MSTRQTAIVSLTLVAGLSLAACSTPAPEPTPVTPRSSSSQTAVPSPTPTPSAAPTTAPPAEWTPEALTGVCVDFQATWAEDNNYAPEDFEWTVPGTAELVSGVWYVFLNGTFTPPGGDPVPAEFSCAISGTPDAPVIVESPEE